MTVKEETIIVRACLKWLLLNKGRGWHVNGSILQPTEPDIDGYVWSSVLNRFLHLKIEMKTTTGKPSKKQLMRIAEYRLAGYISGIASSLAEFIQLIRDYENEQRNAKVD